MTSTAQKQPSIPKPPLRFLSYDEMVALPDPEWQIEGLLMKRTAALIFGKSNAFKSFAAVDIACTVAFSSTWPDNGLFSLDNWHGCAVDDGWSVLYIATEGALGIAKRRIPAWMEAHQVPLSQRNGVYLYPQEIALDDDRQVSDLIRSAAIHSAIEDDHPEKWRNPELAFRLVVIDIFGSSMVGTEVSDETARAWVRNINRIQREIGCATLTIAHTGWADDSRARMHSHFWGSFDTRIKAEGDKDALTYTLTVDRHKDAESGGQWGFRLEKVELPGGGSSLYPVRCDEVVTAKRERVTGKPLVAYQALQEAIAEKGRKITSPNLPSCRVVEIEVWRDYCRRHGITSSDKPDSLQKACVRAQDTLMEKGLIRTFDAFVWMCDKPDEPGQTRTSPDLSASDVRPDKPGHIPLGMSGLSGCPSVPAGADDF